MAAKTQLLTRRDQFVKNLIINGGFDFWQRSIGPVTVNTSAAYAAPDRFQLRSNGGGSSFAAQRSTDTPNSQFEYSLSCTENGDAVTNIQTIFHKIEANTVRPYIGTAMTQSMWVKTETVSGRSLVLRIRTPLSGSKDNWGANPDGETLVYTSNATSPSLGDWTQISYTFVIPAGASNGLMVELADSVPYTGLAVLKTTGWMLTEGTEVPAHFVRAGVSMQQELALCQRYYEKSYAVDVIPGTTFTVGTSGSSGNASWIKRNSVFTEGNFQFKVIKRASPTMVVYNPQTGATGSGRAIDGNGDQPMSVGPYPGGFDTSFTNAVSDRTYFHWTASAEL